MRLCALAFLLGGRFSFPLDVSQKLKEWSQDFPNEQILTSSQVLTSLQEEIDKQNLNDAFKVKKQISSKEQLTDPFEELKMCINSLFTNPKFAAVAYTEYNRLSNSCCNPVNYNSFMPLSGILPATREDLIFFSQEIYNT